MPNIEEFNKIVGTIELAKIINQTRIHSTLNGIVKCKEDISFYKSNKNDRLIEKRLELQEQVT